MEFGPQNHYYDGLLRPNSIMAWTLWVKELSLSYHHKEAISSCLIPVYRYLNRTQSMFRLQAPQEYTYSPLGYEILHDP